MSRENVIDDLYSQIIPLEKVLMEDDDAMRWFKLVQEPITIPSTCLPSSFPLESPTGAVPHFIAFNKLLTWSDLLVESNLIAAPSTRLPSAFSSDAPTGVIPHFITVNEVLDVVRFISGFQSH